MCEYFKRRLWGTLSKAFEKYFARYLQTEWSLSVNYLADELSTSSEIQSSRNKILALSHVSSFRARGRHSETKKENFNKEWTHKLHLLTPLLEPDKY